MGRLKLPKNSSVIEFNTKTIYGKNGQKKIMENYFLVSKSAVRKSIFISQLNKWHIFSKM